MKKMLARTLAVAGLVAGMSAVAAPAAMADVIIVYGSGSGDAVASQVKDSDHVKSNDKSVTTGDLTTTFKEAVKDSPLTLEVEGTEQDQGEKS